VAGIASSVSGMDTYRIGRCVVVFVRLHIPTLLGSLGVVTQNKFCCLF